MNVYWIKNYKKSTNMLILSLLEHENMYSYQMIKKRGKLQNGTAYMVARSGVPVIPVRIIGEFKPFHKIIIEYGKPLDFSNYQSKKPEKENLDMITEKITQAIFKIDEKNKI